MILQNLTYLFLIFSYLMVSSRICHAVRRRMWLTANQQLLRTLSSYCSMHSSQGVGLASVRMELLLLLQELHQVRVFQCRNFIFAIGKCKSTVFRRHVIYVLSLLRFYS